MIIDFMLQLFSVLSDTVLLLAIGILGWFVFSLLKLPVPGILGTMVFIGGLRIMEVDLPFAPGFISPVVQIVLGIFIGSKITRETVKDLGSLIKPAGMIITWTMIIVFFFGYFLHTVTEMDLYSAILSSSMGGLPEMTILSMETDADITSVVIMHTIRMMLTMFLFPIIFKGYMGRQRKINRERLSGNSLDKALSKPDKTRDTEEETIGKKSPFEFLFAHKAEFLRFGQRMRDFSGNPRRFWGSLRVRLISVAVAAVGGYLFYRLGVPAGGMVGAMVFIAAASIGGIRIKPPSSFTFEFLLIGIAITISDNFSRETLEVVASGDLLLPILLSTIVVFGSSLLMALLLTKVTKWDFPTCFLAAAPAGFTVMSTLAIKYEKDAFVVSMLHLGRIMSIKLVVPFAFMVLMR